MDNNLFSLFDDIPEQEEHSGSAKKNKTSKKKTNAPHPSGNTNLSLFDAEQDGDAAPDIFVEPATLSDDTTAPVTREKNASEPASDTNDLFAAFATPSQETPAPAGTREPNILPDTTETIADEPGTIASNDTTETAAQEVTVAQQPETDTPTEEDTVYTDIYKEASDPADLPVMKTIDDNASSEIPDTSIIDAEPDYSGDVLFAEADANSDLYNDTMFSDIEEAPVAAEDTIPSLPDEEQRKDLTKFNETDIQQPEVATSSEAKATDVEVEPLPAITETAATRDSDLYSNTIFSDTAEASVTEEDTTPSLPDEAPAEDLTERNDIALQQPEAATTGETETTDTEEETLPAITETAATRDSDLYNDTLFSDTAEASVTEEDTTPSLPDGDEQHEEPTANQAEDLTKFNETDTQQPETATTGETEATDTEVETLPAITETAVTRDSDLYNDTLFSDTAETSVTEEDTIPSLPDGDEQHQEPTANQAATETDIQHSRTETTAGEGIAIFSETIAATANTADQLAGSGTADGNERPVPEPTDNPIPDATTDPLMNAYYIGEIVSTDYSMFLSLEEKNNDTAVPASAVPDQQVTEPSSQEEAPQSLPEWELSKKYYSIGEVAKLFDVNTSHIRFWSKEFNLKLRTTRKGDRMYTPDDIEKLRWIHELVKVKKHTIKGAREILQTQKKKVVEKIDLKDNLKELKSLLIGIQKKL